MAHRQIFPVTLSAGGHGVGTSALLDALLALVPSPADRAPFPAKNVGGEDVTLKADAAGTPAALVFKTLSDPFTGKISILRVVSGTLSSDTSVYNPRTEESERLGHLMLLQGKQGTNVQKLVAGDIGGVAKLKIDRHRRHPVRQGPPGEARLDRHPRAGHDLRHRAEVEGRRGEDRRGPAPADRRGPRAARRPRRRDRTSTCSRAPASSTSRSPSPS